MINDKRERRGALFVSLESKVASVHVKVPGLSSLVRCNGEQSSVRPSCMRQSDKNPKRLG